MRNDHIVLMLMLGISVILYSSGFIVLGIKSFLTITAVFSVLYFIGATRARNEINISIFIMKALRWAIGANILVFSLNKLLHF